MKSELDTLEDIGNKELENLSTENYKRLEKVCHNFICSKRKLVKYDLDFVSSFAITFALKYWKENRGTKLSSYIYIGIRKGFQKLNEEKLGIKICGWGKYKLIPLLNTDEYGEEYEIPELKEYSISENHLERLANEEEDEIRKRELAIVKLGVKIFSNSYARHTNQYTRKDGTVVKQNTLHTTNFYIWFKKRFPTKEFLRTYCEFKDNPHLKDGRNWYFAARQHMMKKQLDEKPTKKMKINEGIEQGFLE